MTIDGLDDETIRRVLRETRRIALVGASPRPDRPSNRVLAWLIRHGYDVTPVNPVIAGQRLHDRLVVARLSEAGPLDLVDIFRASDKVASIVDDAIRLGARTVWMQLDVIDLAAAAAARAACLTVVMDRCPVIEAGRLDRAA